MVFVEYRWFFCGIAVKKKAPLFLRVHMLSHHRFFRTVTWIHLNMKMIHKPDFTTALLLDAA